MASIWEWVGEQVGYGLAAVILGPGALVERKARREAKRAMLRFARAHEPDVLEAPRGTIRRLVRLRNEEEPLHVEATLDLSLRHVTLATTMPELPGGFSVRVGRAFVLLHPGLRLRVGTPRAELGTIRLDAEDIDDDTANDLLNAIARGPLDGVGVFELLLGDGRAQLLAKAPPTEEAWAELASALLALSAWTRKKWAHSYRT